MKIFTTWHDNGWISFMTVAGRKKKVILLSSAVLVVIGLSVPTYFWWQARETVRIAAACRMAIRKEEWDQAQPLAEQWVRRAPQDTDAWLSLADVAKSQGDLTATAECLARVPVLDPRYLKTQMLRGDLILDGLGRPHDAVNVWLDMLKVDPTATVAHQRLLYVYSMTLQREKLVVQIREAIQNKSEPPEAYGYILAAPNLLFTDGYLRVDKWLKATPDDEVLRVAHAVFAARTNPSRGMKMFGVGDVQPGDDAGVIKCLKDYPNNLELRAFLIERAISNDDMAALGASLKDLPAAADKDSRFWRYIGALRDFQRRPAEAAEALKRSLELHPLDWKSHHAMATVERVLGHVDVASKHADLAARGKQLEREIQELPNAAQVDPPLLARLQAYAQDCGDHGVADGLKYRLQ